MILPEKMLLNDMILLPYRPPLFHVLHCLYIPGVNNQCWVFITRRVTQCIPKPWVTDLICIFAVSPVMVKNKVYNYDNPGLNTVKKPYILILADTLVHLPNMKHMLEQYIAAVYNQKLYICSIKCGDDRQDVLVSFMTHVGS